MTKLKTFFKTDSFIGNVLKISSGTIVAQILTYVLLPLVTRLYSPKDFGELGIYMAAFGVISPLLGGKFELAIILENDENKKPLLYFLSAVITFSISIISFFIILTFGHSIINFFALDIDYDLFALLPGFFLFFGLYQANKFYLVSNNSFGVISKMTVLEKLVNLGSKFTFGFLHIGSLGLIMSEFLSKASGLIYSFAKMRAITFFKIIKKNNLFELRYLVRKYKKFPTYELASDWFDSISNNIPLLLLAFYFDNVAVGSYLLADRIIKNVVSLTSKNFSSVYYRRVTEIEENNRKSFTSNLIRKLSVIGFMPFLILSIGAPEIFALCFGNNWFDAGVCAQILSPYLLIFFMLKPISSLYRVYNQQDQLFYFNIINFIVFCLAVYWGGLIQDFKSCLIAVSLAGILVYGWIYFWILNKINITIIHFINLIKVNFLKVIGFLFVPILIKIFYDDQSLFLISLLIFIMIYYTHLVVKYNNIIRLIFKK